MARTPEQRAWDDLGPQIKNLTSCVDRIESIGTGAGIPDIAYSWQNGHGWIELKADEKCIAPGDSINLSHYTPIQRTWMRRRTAWGKNLWLMVRTAYGWYAVPGTLAWALPARPTHGDMMKHGAWYRPENKVAYEWLRQFL